MKINFTTYNLRPSGGARVILEVANHLTRRGHQVSITLPIRESGRPMWRIEVPVYAPSKGRYVEGSSVLDTMIRGGFLLSRKLGHDKMFDGDLIRKLAVIAPECDFNIATLFPTAFSVHRSGKGIPLYYVQCHEAEFENDLYLKRMAEESYLLPINTVVVSTYLQKLLRDRYSKDSYVCLNGVDHNVFYPRKKKESKLATVMCIGRSAKWKGLSDVVKAMNIVHKQFREVELVICGWDTIQVENAQFPYRIKSCPTDESLAQQYSDSDIFVSASTLEGFGLPALEAMACGTTVVSTSIANEDYAVDEVNSLLVPPRRPDEIAKSILRLLQDDTLRFAC